MCPSGAVCPCDVFVWCVRVEWCVRVLCPCGVVCVLLPVVRGAVWYVVLSNGLHAGSGWLVWCVVYLCGVWCARVVCGVPVWWCQMSSMQGAAGCREGSGEPCYPIFSDTDQTFSRSRLWHHHHHASPSHHQHHHASRVATNTMHHYHAALTSHHHVITNTCTSPYSRCNFNNCICSNNSVAGPPTRIILLNIINRWTIE